MTITQQELATLSAALRARGIESAAAAMRWQPCRYNGALGWSYPIFSLSGDEYGGKRFKALAGNPRYAWVPSMPARARYYFKPGLAGAIAAAGGWVYIAAGEPDTLAYLSAGKDNALTWLSGEGSPPATLASDLTYLGAKNAIYAPDCDVAGMRSAAKVKALLEGSGIGLHLYALPGDMGSGFDINDLWVEVGGDRADFDMRLALCDPIDPIALHLYAKQQGAGEQVVKQVSARVDDWRSAWINQIVAALGAPAVIEAGRGRWHCPLPHHEDRNPSFRVSADQNPAFPWPMCSCGIQSERDAWDRVADALGVQPWVDFKAERAAETGYTAPSKAALSQAPNDTPAMPDKAAAETYVSLKDKLAQVERVITGQEAYDGAPVSFPFRLLHKFGGFARWAWRGKMVAVVGVSGGGKTVLLEMMALEMMRQGGDVVWWGPEWSPFEYALRNLQRSGGLSMDRVGELLVWFALEAQGVPVEDRSVPAPPKAAIDQSLAVLKELSQMPGDMLFLPDMTKPLPALLDDLRAIVKARRADGRDVVGFFFDYAQLANLNGARDWTWGERVVQHVKKAISPRDCNLVGFMSSQSRKDDSAGARKGESLTHASGQGITDHAFNLYLGFTPDFDEDGTAGKFGTLSVLKNNLGRLGKLRVLTNFAKLSIEDAEVETRNINEYVAEQHRNGNGRGEAEHMPF